MRKIVHQRTRSLVDHRTSSCNEKTVHESTLIRAGHSQREPKTNMISRNKSRLTNHFKLKNSARTYCPESGDLSKEDIDDYWRGRFISDVVRDAQNVDMSEKQPDVCMAQLKVMENTPYPE